MKSHLKPGKTAAGHGSPIQQGKKDVPVKGIASGTAASTAQSGASDPDEAETPGAMVMGSKGLPKPRVASGFVPGLDDDDDQDSGEGEDPKRKAMSSLFRSQRGR